MSHIDAPSVVSLLPKNSWALFISLALGRWQPSHSWQKLTYRYKFILRSLAMPFSTAKLMKNLASQPLLLSILAAQPGLPCRLHRPYLALNITRSKTLAVIAYHYQNFTERLSEAMLKTYFTEQGYYLAELKGKNDERYFISISGYDLQGKEGETSLNFCDDQHVILSKLTFTLCHKKGKKTLFIGGLQGAKPWIPHESIQTATKACHGLFPKRLLLETLCILANQLDVEQILAVGNSTHIFRSWRYEKKKKQLMHSDYDSFWLSMGGILLDDSLFLLRPTVERKSLKDIASKKRAEYRRRYELLDNLAHSIDTHFKSGHNR